jgi:ATP-dependent helicase HrpB
VVAHEGARLALDSDLSLPAFLLRLPNAMPPTTKVPLPIDDVLTEITARVAESNVLVLQAPPGAGKTTRVPPALLDAGVPGKIVVLEPRRLAARLAARRVAAERGEAVGSTIGYEVRFDRSISPSTRIEFVTEGILTRRLMADPELRGVGAIVLDEFHERHLQGDLALALLARLRASTRPELKLVVMSATLDVLPVADYLGAPVVKSSGRQYDVAVTYQSEPDSRPLESQVVSAIRDLLRQGTKGDVLVFLPGAAEIRRSMDRAAPFADEANLLLVALHGDLSPDAQDIALQPAACQKVIFSTNVAETSVTIEGVEAVVDSGLARIAKYDPWSGRPSLEVAKISRASAAQRAGRAGRLGPGKALRLYAKGDHDARPEHESPEILRADLAETVLALRASGVKLAEMKWLDAPPRSAVDGAEQLLIRLGALDGQCEITDVGRKMLQFAAPPRLAKLIVEAASRGAAREGCVAAAILAEGRDIYARSWDAPHPVAGGDESSDLTVRVAAFEEATRGGFDRQRVRQLGLVAEVVLAVKKASEQYARQCTKGPRTGEPDEIVRRAVLAAFPDRVARRRQATRDESRLGASRELVLCTGGTAQLAETSVVRTAPWLVAVEAGDRGVADLPRGRSFPTEKRRTRVWLASSIEPEWLIDLFSGSVEEKIEVTWSAERERVEAVERLSYDRLVLDERPAGAAADEAAAKLLLEKALSLGVGALAGEAFDGLSRRMSFVVQGAPDLAERAELTSLDEAGLAPLLAASLAGKRSLAELRDGSLLDEIRAAIGHRKLARLAELAPEHMTLGGGRRVAVNYEPGKPPWIESRLQDFFGSSETPRILEGRVALVLHLLAPNGRDVQVTTDLAGFWERTYPAVRNELMRRYPRHAWPEDPAHATPPAPRPPRRRS